MTRVLLLAPIRGVSAEDQPLVEAYCTLLREAGLTVVHSSDWWHENLWATGGKFPAYVDRTVTLVTSDGKPMFAAAVLTPGLVGAASMEIARGFLASKRRVVQVGHGEVTSFQPVPGTKPAQYRAF